MSDWKLDGHNKAKIQLTKEYKGEDSADERLPSGEDTKGDVRPCETIKVYGVTDMDINGHHARPEQGGSKYRYCSKSRRTTSKSQRCSKKYDEHIDKIDQCLTHKGRCDSIRQQWACIFGSEGFKNKYPFVLHHRYLSEHPNPHDAPT